MQKIRCPRCGVVNLEGFLTFPQCAGCGSTLPPRSNVASFWRRPVKSWLWIPLAGGVLAGAIALLSLLQTPEENNEAVILYGSTVRRGEVGALLVLGLTVDAAVSVRVRRSDPLRDVKVRLPLELFKSLRFVSVSPAPDAMTISGNSRYFHYETLPRETTIALRLRAVRPGRQKFRASLYATDYLPADWRFSVVITPRSNSKSKPASSR